MRYTSNKKGETAHNQRNEQPNQEKFKTPGQKKTNKYLGLIKTSGDERKN